MLLDKNSFLLMLLAFISQFSFSQSIDTIPVYFGIDRYACSPSSIQAIETLKQADSLHLFGYTDYLGSSAYNQVLSNQRVNSVSECLTKNGISPKQITLKKGLGEITQKEQSSPIGNPTNRRVDILAFSSQHSSPTGTSQGTVSELENFNTAKYKVGDKIVLKGLSFIPGRHFLLDSNAAELSRLIQIMENNPNLHIEIQGHVCCISRMPDGMNDGVDFDTREPFLSVNRAKFIYEQLIKADISSSRLSYAGFGASRPKISPEVTDEDRQANRRVEIEIIAK
tara:strand:- start:6367 stop:7212 length:846 start_codon:yes stop_codon:yes gene_type:complete